MEGGSANDYDYCSGDPVNCYDLAGTIGMIYVAWDSPPWGFVSGDSAEIWWGARVGTPYAASHANSITRHPQEFKSILGRIPDWRVGSQLIEVKAGKVYLTSKIKKQVDADAKLRKAGYGVQWDFYASPVTGLGPSGPLLAYLLKNDINVVIHPPSIGGL